MKDESERKSLVIDWRWFAGLAICLLLFVAAFSMYNTYRHDNAKDQVIGELRSRVEQLQAQVAHQSDLSACRGKFALQSLYGTASYDATVGKMLEAAVAPPPPGQTRPDVKAEVQANVDAAKTLADISDARRAWEANPVLPCPV